LKGAVKTGALIATIIWFQGRRRVDDDGNLSLAGILLQYLGQSIEIDFYLGALPL
jgi:hypothetical protein